MQISVNHKNDLVRAGCLTALGKMRVEPKVLLSVIHPLCRDGHPRVRGLAFLALLQQATHDRQQVTVILERLKHDPQPEVAEAARHHLKQLAKQR